MMRAISSRQQQLTVMEEQPASHAQLPMPDFCDTFSQRPVKKMERSGSHTRSIVDLDPSPSRTSRIDFSSREGEDLSYRDPS
jgi:hypothetical protein